MSSQRNVNGTPQVEKVEENLAAKRSPETSAEPFETPELRLSNGPWICLLIIAASAILYGLYSTRAIAFPITLSVLVALPLRPLVRICNRVGLPNPLSATLIVAILLFAVISGTTLLWKPAKEWISTTPSNMKEVEQKLRTLQGPISEMQEASESVEKLTEAKEDPTTLKVEVKPPSLTSAVLSTTGSVLVGGTITVSLVFLLLAFGDQLLDGVVHAWPTRRDRKNILTITKQAERTISHYLLTYTMINIGLGIVIGLGMWAIGMPNPVLWGVMAACLNYVPFVGLAAGTAIVFVVGVISFDSLTYALLAPAIYLAANGVEANVITPMLLGRSLKLNVVFIFLFIVIWGWMWGIGGALIAVPLLIVAKVICDNISRLRPLAQVLCSA